MKILNRLTAVSLIAAAAFLHVPGMSNSANAATAAADGRQMTTLSLETPVVQAYYKYHGHRYSYRWHGRYYNHRRGGPNHWSYY